MRIILFTGKGGVGKTTTAAATALQCAAKGLRTLVVSTDPAHSLADALNVQLSPEPVKVAPNLWGQEFDVYYSMKKHWDNMRQLMLTIFRWRGVKNIVAEELSVLPGMEEASAFLWIEKYYRENQYDVLIIDSAPTGETLTLLSLPQVMQSWLTKAFPGQQLAIKTAGWFLRKTKNIPLDKGYEELKALLDKLEIVQKIMLNPKVCSIRIVANPERMVVQEAKRAYTYLQLYGYNVDAVIVNRILPETAGGEGSPFVKYLQAQTGYLQDIEESFEPLPILKVMHAGEEVFGLPLLEKIAQSLYKEHDAAAILLHQNPFEVSETERTYQIKIRLPFIAGQEFEVKKFGDEVVISLGNRRKSVFLPRFANFLEMQRYDYASPYLSLTLLKS